MRARLREEDGWALAASIVLLATMLIVGLALLTVVDTQSRASAWERQTDSAFNLAEGALNGEAFLLSRSWPDAMDNNGNCSAPGQALTGTLAPTTGTDAASLLQRTLGATYTGGDFALGGTWTVNICDDLNRTTSWDDTLLTAPRWDSNGADPANGNLRRIWVRAQATVAGRTRAVVGLVQVDQRTILPPKYGVVGGGLRTDLVTTTGTALSGSVVQPMLQQLIGNHQAVKPDPAVAGSGHVGVRCGLLSGCLEGAFAALSQTALTSVVGDTVQHWGTSTMTTDARITELRQQAIASGTYYKSAADGSACLTGDLTGKVVFIEQVGTDGNGTCTITTSSASITAAKAIVVASGRIRIQGNGTFRGVVYGLDRQVPADQASPATEVVGLFNSARVDGAVFTDGNSSRVGIHASYNMQTLLNALGLCGGLTGPVLCNSLLAGSTSDLLNYVIGVAGLQNVVNALLQQPSPTIQEDDAVTAQVTSYGTSGTIASTFRQVPVH